jgi:hypothetical protein
MSVKCRPGPLAGSSCLLQPSPQPDGSSVKTALQVVPTGATLCPGYLVLGVFTDLTLWLLPVSFWLPGKLSLCTVSDGLLLLFISNQHCFFSSKHLSLWKFCVACSQLAPLSSVLAPGAALFCGCFVLCPVTGLQGCSCQVSCGQGVSCPISPRDKHHRDD